ncbi:MAG: hypothetical protein PVS3B3_08170 [Ktedonobacteraceae bacterium]
MIEPRNSFVDTDDIRLYYLEWDPVGGCDAQQQARVQDNDEIPIVLLHGLGATADTWCLVAQDLCHKHLVVAFDQRGHGKSAKPTTGYDLATIAEDAIQGMAALGLGQVALVGHGWGARVALVMAARHPALVSHLILVDCPHVEPRHWPDMTRDRFIDETDTKHLYVSQTAFVEEMRQEMHSFWSPEVEAILLKTVQERSDGSLEECLQPDKQRLIRESLWDDRALSYYSKLSCPVLLIPAAGEPQPDKELPERLEHTDEFAEAKGYMAAQVAEVIQRCSVLWMPNTSHDIQLQHPHILAQAIIRFMSNEKGHLL